MKIGRNEPCPCGSGKKYKKCCMLGQTAAVAFSTMDRDQAYAKMEDFVMEYLVDEDDDAYEEFWAPFSDDDRDNLDSSWQLFSDDIYDMWFYFDRPLEDGRSVADLLLELDTSLTPEERHYLQITKSVSIRLYDILDLVPGSSITLRDFLDGSVVTVSEQKGSKSMTRHMCIGARVIPRGPSGKPEIERGCFNIPELIKSYAKETVRDKIKELQAERPGMTVTQCYKELTPFLHEMWMTCILEPPIPDLANRDGEEIVWTRVLFNVLDEKRLKSAINRVSAFVKEEEDDNEWHWHGNEPKGDQIILGRLELGGNQLLLETNSVERAAKGRELIEKRAGASIRHHITTHENFKAKLREKLRNRRQDFDEDMPAPEEIPREIKEELVLDNYAKYYRKWIDESIPALKGKTPREAAKNTALHPELIELVSGLERFYEISLKRGEPAYDPSWMWKELGLKDQSDVKWPPMLAHERLAQMVEGFGDLCRELAFRTRKAPSFEDNVTILDENTVGATLDVQRFLRRTNPPDPQTTSGDTGDSHEHETQFDSVAFISFATNYELYLRKTFWVDPELAYMLLKTDADVPGGDLKMPFQSFALVFSDRCTLSLAERLLSIDGSTPLAGFILRVLTVYLTETRDGADRAIRVGLASDALGSDLPELFAIDVAMPDDLRMSCIVEKAIEKYAAQVSKAAAGLLGKLLGVVFNAVLYATSAGVETELRPAKKQYAEAGSRSNHDGPAFSSEDVFYLPGSIDISNAKPLQELERTSEGGKLIHRFMVRGHWRRPNPTWKDRRLRWIAPYWKGPDLAAIIERTYRLTP